MRCQTCHCENPDAARFCMECATPFALRCPSCGTENPQRAKFCAQCSKALVAMTAASHVVFRPDGSSIAAKSEVDSILDDAERKNITALFADIKGSMELMEDLDPEEARSVIDPALKLMIEAARRYDGYVVQSTGDGIFALFGAPLAHEDHPQRALYAALRLQEELKRYSDRMRREGKLPLQARVGVNTGEVVVRSIQTGDAHTEYTPIGHTANLAARMQVLAPIGSIAATEQVRRLCEGYFLFKSLGPTTVKGVSESVNVYEVIGLGPLRTRLQRSAGRGLTKFVGREREMEALRYAAEQAKSGRGQIVAAMGEPGVGKSRLFFEFKAMSQSAWMVLEAFSISHGKASAYLPAIDLLRNYFRFTTEDDERTRREKVTGRVLALDRSLEDTLPYFFSLLGIVEGVDPLAQMDAQIKKRRTLEAIKRILLRESLNQPLMVIFEDLHWIDEATHELLNLLADSIGTAKILLLVNYRPEYSHQWGSKTYYTQLRLDPLGNESAEEMLLALLGDGKDLLPLKRLIIERTQGTPFFMEEMVQVLFDEGALVRNGVTHLIRPLAELKIPATVQGILAARIDRLPTDAKELLQTLAVLGREFPSGLVRVVTRGSDDDLNRLLNDLQLAEFIYEQPAVGDTEYIFKHALTQEVAYNSLLFERRKFIHERIAAAMETLFAGQLDDHLDDLAHHYGRSSNIDKAVHYLRRAAERAMSRSSYRNAQEAIEAALALVDALADTHERSGKKLGLLNILAQVLYPQEGWAGPQVESALARALVLVPLVTDGRETQATLVFQWLFTYTTGILDHSKLIIDRMQEHAAGVPALVATAHIPAANTYFYVGEFEESARHGDEGVRLWRPEYYNAALWPGDLRALALSFRGRALAAMGFADRGLHCIQQALAIGREESSKFSYLIVLLEHTYWYAVLLSDPKLSAWIAEEALRVLEELDSPERNVFQSYAAWPHALATGQFEDAIETLERTVRIEKSMRQQMNASFHLAQVADLCVRAKLPERGLAVVEEALLFADSSRAHHNLAELWRLRGEMLLLNEVRTDPDITEAFTNAIEIARKQSGKALELRATMSFARLLGRKGRRDEAHTILAEIYGWFTEGFDTADLKDAKALLDELGT